MIAFASSGFSKSSDHGVPTKIFSKASKVAVFLVMFHFIMFGFAYVQILSRSSINKFWKTSTYQIKVAVEFVDFLQYLLLMRKKDHQQMFLCTCLHKQDSLSVKDNLFANTPIFPFIYIWTVQSGTVYFSRNTHSKFHYT